MSDILNPNEFNAMFASALSGGDNALEKLGEATGLYIQDKLRESSFARKILPPQTVTASELTRNDTDEGLCYVDDIEPDSIAMAVNMRGEPNNTYIKAPRYKITMSVIASERFQKSESELRSYRMPLTKVIEQNTVKDIQERVDVKFMRAVKTGIMLATESRMASLVAAGTIAAGAHPDKFATDAAFSSYLAGDLGPGIFTATTTTTYSARQHLYSNLILSDSDTFDREVLRDIVKVLSSRQLKARCFLVHETTWNDVIAWGNTEAGLELTSEITKDGYKYSTVAGYTFVTSIRDNAEIIAPGQIFVFPEPSFLGRYLILETTKFSIKREGRFISMEAWEEMGIGFGNLKGLACILLKGASITLPANFSSEASTKSVTITNNVGSGLANLVAPSTGPAFTSA